MANRTAKDAVSVRGTNPQFIIHPMVRARIYLSKYWKEHCTLLNSALVLERAVDDLKYVGTFYGANTKITPFMCLILKLLQIQPQKEIIYLYIEQPDFKYLRALGAIYLRFVGAPVEVYTRLEPLYKDYRKLRIMDNQHIFTTLHMDELIDNLLREENLLGLTLPRLTKRIVLEDNRDIDPYKSELEEQNLIPTQLIEEKVEESRSRTRLSSSQQLDHRDRHYKQSGGYRHYEDHHRRQDNQSYRRNDNRRRNNEHADRYSAPSSSSAASSSSRKSGGRFSQALIDDENAIRAKLGLKPLQV